VRKRLRSIHSKFKFQIQIALNHTRGSYDSGAKRLHRESVIVKVRSPGLMLSRVNSQFVFFDPESGFEQYQDLAQNHGHIDSMVACGIILVEALGGIRHREAEGVAWLKRAIALVSCQALYELGTANYTGMDGVVPEDSGRAYSLFEKAAAQGHVGATYMMADCLLEGEGTKMDVARAVPLLYQAADQGHRYARQRVRELLKDKTYQN
jgi:TPR repeat protein